jgi:hypothetical protein
MTARRERFIPAGTKVSYDGTGAEEFGVVVHCWFARDIQGYDCYVAFFGDEMPTTGKPKCIPYVLRYAATSLTIVDE